MTGGPWLEEDLCSVCPAQLFGPGKFDVEERPSPASRYDPGVGYRVNAAKIAVCVHPFRVGLPAGRYASHRDPVPAVQLGADEVPLPPHEALEPPVDVEDMEAWMIATLRLAGPSRLDTALEELQVAAFERFPEGAVVDALRVVLGRELARATRPRPAPRSRGGRS